MENEQDFYRDVGRRVRDARKKSGMTQHSLASKVSLSRASITNLEMGRQKLMLHTLVDIASELHVAPDDLIPKPRALPAPPLNSLLKNRSQSEQAWIGPALNSFLPEAGPASDSTSEFPTDVPTRVNSNLALTQGE